MIAVIFTSDTWAPLIRNVRKGESEDGLRRYIGGVTDFLLGQAVRELIVYEPLDFGGAYLVTDVIREDCAEHGKRFSISVHRKENLNRCYLHLERLMRNHSRIGKEVVIFGEEVITLDLMVLASLYLNGVNYSIGPIERLQR